jgi:hypothetical protein
MCNQVKLLLFRTKPVRLDNGAAIDRLGVLRKFGRHRSGDAMVIEIPEARQQKRPCEYAWVFRIHKPELGVFPL